MAWKVFIFPFRPRVWTALLLFAITCTIGLWTFHQYQQFEGNLEGVSPSCTSWSNLTRMAKLLVLVKSPQAYGTSYCKEEQGSPDSWSERKYKHFPGQFLAEIIFSPLANILVLYTSII